MVRCSKCGADGHWAGNCHVKVPDARKATPAVRRLKARTVQNLTAPPGQCGYCDRRRKYAADLMKAHRQKEKAK